MYVDVQCSKGDKLAMVADTRLGGNARHTSATSTLPALAAHATVILPPKEGALCQAEEETLAEYFRPYAVRRTIPAK